MTPAIVAMAAVLSCEAPSSTALVGLWETVETSKGGIGQTLEFKEEGSFVEAPTVILDLVYRFEDDKLYAAPDAAALAALQAGSSIKLEGDVLVQTGPDGSPIRKERMAGAEAGTPAIVGTWRYRHYTGVMAFERYTADGSLEFRLPMTSAHGCYVLDGSRVTLAGSDGSRARGTFRIEGDRLELRRGRNTTVYRRSSAGAWYPREPVDVQKPEGGSAWEKRR